MKPAQFEYHLPSDLPDALAILAAISEDDGQVLAGGQSLVPAMALRMAQPRHLLDIGRLAELRHIREADGYLVVGAGIRHAAFHDIVTANPLGRLMQRVVGNIAHYAIRTRGTLCGSLALADPASEWCCTATALNAEIVAESVRGSRTIPITEFIDGALMTTLQPDEILTGVRLPLLQPDARFAFTEVSRRSGDFALAMALVTFRLVENVIVEPRIAVAGVEDHARRIASAEAVLDGAPLSAGLLGEAADVAADDIDVSGAGPTSPDYRKSLVRAVVLRCLKEAAHG